MLTPEFGHWLAGLADGEGSFALWFHDRICEPMFNLVQRADNLALLLKIKDVTGLGYVRTSKQYSQKNPMSTWVVRKVPDCISLISLFRTYPLRGTKAEVFSLWSIAVEQFLSRGLFPPRILHEAIKAKKHFRLHKLEEAIPPREFECLVREIENDRLEHMLENQINAIRRQ